MVVTRAQVTIKTTDALPANFLTNTLYFDQGTSVATFDAIRDQIVLHYSSLASQFYPSTVAQVGHEIKFYDVLQAPPSYPIVSYVFNMAATPSGDPLPSEVALVASFQGPKISGIKQARRRGRNYIGPLKASLNTLGRPSATALTNLAAAYDLFGTQVNAITDVDWVVWSGVSLTATPITDGWVDNAFDTQRRRGVQTTSRTTYVL